MEFLKKFTKKNMAKNHKRTLVTVIGVMLSTALICAVAGMAATFRSSLIKNEIASSGLLQGYFYNVPVEYLNLIESNVHVEEMGLVQTVGFAKPEGFELNASPYISVRAMDDEAYHLFSVHLLEGRLPENNREVIIPQSLSSLGEVDFNVGDTITLNVGERHWEDQILYERDQYIYPGDYYSLLDMDLSEYLGEDYSDQDVKDAYGTVIPDEGEHLENINQITYTVVGISDSNSIYLADWNTVSFVFFTKETKEAICAGQGPLTVATTFDNTKKIGEYVNSIHEAYEELLISGETDNYVSANKTELARYMGSMGGRLWKTFFTLVAVILLIIVATSVFVITNSFSISVSEKVSQYGMLSSIGATKRQIRLTVLLEGLYIGVAGLISGILLGVGVVYILTLIVNYLMRDVLFSLYFDFPLWVVLVAVLLTAVTIYFSCILPAAKAAKISPVEAIRGNREVERDLKQKKLKTKKFIRKLFGIGGVLASKSLKRSKRKYRATVISLALGVAVFIGLSSFVDLGFGLVSTEYADINYDISLYYSMGSEEDHRIFFDKVAKLDEVDDMVVYNDQAFGINPDKYATKEYKEYCDRVYAGFDGNRTNEEYVSVLLMTPEDFKEYAEEVGVSGTDYKNMAILINETQNLYDGRISRMQIYDVKDNDVLEGHLYVQELSGNEHDSLNVIVSEGTDTYGTVAIDSYGEDMIDGKYLMQIPITKVTDIRPRGFEGTYYDSGYLVMPIDRFDRYANLAPGHGYIVSSDPKAAEAAITELVMEEGISENIFMQNVYLQAEQTNRIFLTIGIFLYGFVIVIVLIGVTNVINTIATNMQLRAGEFAMLRSMGMTKKQFNRMIRLESIMYGSKALIYGTPIGLILSVAIHRAFGISYSIAYRLPVRAILIAIIFVALIVGFTMHYALGKINKGNMIETIRRRTV